MSYIKDSNDFTPEINDLNDIPKDALLVMAMVTADVVGSYPIIRLDAGLTTLTAVLDRRNNKRKTAEFVLKSNYFELNGKVKHQISGKLIERKLAPTYACIFMDEIATTF